MAQKKTAPASAKKTSDKATGAKKRTKGGDAKQTSPKVAKMFTTAGRLFTASQSKALAKGTVVELGTVSEELKNLMVRVGTKSRTVFEGSFLDLASKAFAELNLKVHIGGNLPDPKALPSV